LYFYFNQTKFFSSKKLRINLNVPLKSVEQKDIANVRQTIDEDRRQTLKHALLMQEVVQQLSSRFKPSIPIVKVNEILIITK